MTEFWIFSAIATVVLIIGLIRDLRPEAVLRGVLRWSERFGLSLTDDVHSSLLRRRRMTSLGYDLGLWFGMETGAVAVLLSGPQWSLAESLAIQGCWLVTGGLGAVLGGRLGARLSPMTGPRVARGRAVTLADYVDPVERATGPIAAVLALAAGLAPVLLGARGSAVDLAAVTGVGSVVILVVSEAIARAGLRRPQPASIPHVLAWSDALRSESARNTLSGSTMITLATLIVSLPAASAATGWGARSSDVAMWTAFGFVAAIAAFGIRSLVTRPARYFLLRLWPATAAELAENERPLEPVS